jgi:hypothetical protein
VPLFPPATPVTIVINGRPLASYQRAYVAGGRVFAPVDPLLVRLADRIWYDGDTLVVERGTRRVRVRLAGLFPEQLDGAYVAAGPVLRGLGIASSFDPAGRRLLILIASGGVVATPTPFDPALPSAPPAAVFTPAPALTPRPVWTGSPLPRRTPLDLPPAKER